LSQGISFSQSLETI